MPIQIVMEIPEHDIVGFVIRILNEQNLVEINDTRCTVCLNYFQRTEEVVLTTCNHLYHRKCIDHWLQKVISKARQLS